jgi:hypothetical protein
MELLFFYSSQSRLPSEEIIFSGMTDGCLRKTMLATSETSIFRTEMDIVDGDLAKLLILEGFK